MFILLLAVCILLLSAVSPIRAITASTPLLFCVIWGCIWAPPPRATPPSEPVAQRMQPDL